MSASAAIVIEEPGKVDLRMLELCPAQPDQVVVKTRWSGISTGTERLLFTGRMPAFPGMGYPLVPGYETVGEVVWAGADTQLSEGQAVFVPGASCYSDARALFGGAAATLIAAADRVLPLPGAAAAEDVLYALGGTALRMLRKMPAPELVIGHGALGQLLVRLVRAQGQPLPTVWETSGARNAAQDYTVLDATTDPRGDYARIIDVSGSLDALGEALAVLAPGGEIILGGFYGAELTVPFPLAFMREARFTVSAEFQANDLADVAALKQAGQLVFSGLLSHVAPVAQASDAYHTAFNDSSCLKMALDWNDAGSTDSESYKGTN